MASTSWSRGSQRRLCGTIPDYERRHWRGWQDVPVGWPKRSPARRLTIGRAAEPNATAAAQNAEGAGQEGEAMQREARTSGEARWASAGARPGGRVQHQVLKQQEAQAEAQPR
mmetsp:Transcript_50822/g.108290  ORF Transcript_50822/g.108290 Transcript_50822/m.108290 type:complete len:113 (-) Transcript_50822:17-355(-)